MRNLNDVRAMMEAVGIPGRDAYHLPTSGHVFPDGGHYRMEISGIERPQVLAALIDEMHKRQIAIHRLISVVIMIFGVTLFFNLARALLNPDKVRFPSFFQDWFLPLISWLSVHASLFIPKAASER